MRKQKGIHMKNCMKKIAGITLSLSMMFTIPIVGQTNLKTIKADEGIVTSFKYDYAYTTPGYADGTIYINANEDGVYKVFWGDADGRKLTNKGHEYSYLARVVVKDGKGSFNIINDYTAIPDGAKTALVYKKDSLVYQYDIPESKQFKTSENAYTFGSISDPHFTRYSSVYEDDAVPAMDAAMDFLDDAGIKFVAMSGDLTQAGEQKALDRYNAALNRHPDMTVVTAIGNHDSRTTIKTSDTSILDTSITRWYNSITSSYYTVEDGQVKVNENFKAKGYDILATDALSDPIATQYRETAGAQARDTEVPGLDFVTEAGGNIFIFFNDIAKTGETYDTDKLVTTSQLDWLEKQLETYKDRKVFLYQHYYLCVNTLNNDAVDANNSTGDLKNDGGYSYDLDYKDVVKTSSGKNLQQLLSEYSNATLVSGHSHWQYSMQNLNRNLNFGRLAGGNGATMIHLSSVTEPRYIGKDDASRTSLNGYASEGATVTTYDDCTVYNNIDFTNKQYEAYATYIVPTTADSQYQPVKNPDYKESADEIVGDEYLDAEDLTEIQLLKSDFNLLKGAAYKYSSKGTENTDTALTDGVSTTTFWNSKWGSKSDQRVTVETEGVQSVRNLKSFMLYFVSDGTSSKNFNIQLSLDGENFETVYTAPSDYSYKTHELKVDTDSIQLKEFKYVRLNLPGAVKDYGYQVRELAAIGYERNQTKNTAGSASSLEENAPVDESEFLETDYNLVYAADYTQSSVGSENKEGALTDGKTTNFANTERSSSAKDQTFVIDIGKSNIQKVSNIAYVLLYNQNNRTNATDFEVSVSLDGENYETIGTYNNVEVDQEHFDVDTSKVTLDTFRYVKLHLKNGNTDYGYQIKEFAVIGENPIEYPEITDQSSAISSDKNIALNKTVYVSSTYDKEGKDPTVLTDGKKDKYWSSDWDNTRTSEYVVVDLGTEVDASSIDRVLVNFKSNNTFCEKYSIEVSKTFDQENPDEGFYEIGRTKAVSWDILQKRADSNGNVVTAISDVEPDMIRYVKINMAGHNGYGYQLYEVAVIKSEKKLDDCTMSVGEITPVYNGNAQTVPVVVEYNGKQLTENVDYKLTYKDNVKAGTATVTAIGMGDYVGSISRQFEIQQLDINSDMITKDFSNIKSSYEYIIMEIMTPVKLKLNNSLLAVGIDYTVSYENNLYPGTATVTFTGQGNYTGTITKTFNIVKRNMSNVTVKAYFDSAKKLVVTANVPDNGRGLIEGTDFVYIQSTDATGNVTVTVKAIGDNFTGSKNITIKAEDNPNKPVTTTPAPTTKKITVGKVKLSKAKNVKGKKIKITWKKIKGATGYKVRFALSKAKLKKAKAKTVKKNVSSYIIKKLKNKKYFVQVRAYKVVNKKTYMGAWSNFKSAKVSK